MGCGEGSTDGGRVGRGRELVFQEERLTCLEFVGSLRRALIVKGFFMALSCEMGVCGSLM